MLNVICFGVGVVIGCNIGFVLCALCSANGRNKDE